MRLAPLWLACASLITIARNLVFDFFKSGRYRLELISEMSPLEHDRPDRDPGPEESAVADETARILWAAVDRLLPDQHEVLVLRFARGLSLEETAQAMGRRAGAVKALQYRATRALRGLMAAAR